MEEDGSLVYDMTDAIKEGEGMYFVWNAARILSKNKNERVSFSYMGKDGTSFLSVTDFKKLGDFKSSMMMYTDENCKEAYDHAFGAQDMDYLTEKKMKGISDKYDVNQDTYTDFEIRTNDELWFFSSFDKGSKRNFGESDYDYVELNGYGNTKEDAEKAYNIINESIRNYATIRSVDENLLSKRKLVFMVPGVAQITYELKDEGGWTADVQEKDDGTVFADGYLKLVTDNSK